MECVAGEVTPFTNTRLQCTSVSVGFGLSSFLPIAVEMFHVAFEMKLRNPGRKGVFCGVRG